MVAYKIKLEPDDNDTLLVTCPDLLGVTTFGEDREAAVAHAVDAIETWLASLMADGEEIPRPRLAYRLKANEAQVPLPTLTALKLELYWTLKEPGITRAELVRRLKWNRESVDRLFRLDHASRLDQIEQAFRAMGKAVKISVDSVAA